jgi:hypothetical protein
VGEVGHRVGFLTERIDLVPRAARPDREGIGRWSREVVRQGLPRVPQP